MPVESQAVTTKLVGHDEQGVGTGIGGHDVFPFCRKLYWRAKTATIDDPGKTLCWSAFYEGSRYWATQNKDANAQVLVDAMSYSLEYPASLLADQWQREIGAELNLGWTQKKSMKDAIVEAARIGNDILRREQDELRARGV
jgi:hypothetical protein